MNTHVPNALSLFYLIFMSNPENLGVGFNGEVGFMSK